MGQGVEAKVNMAFVVLIVAVATGWGFGADVSSDAPPGD